MSLNEFCKEAAAKIGVQLSDSMIDTLFAYKDFCLEYNQKTNLTAIVSDEEFVLKHFIDSMSLLPYLEKGGKLIDIGTGAGFPGAVLKICRPDLSVTLLDSLGKRILFLEEASQRLGLSVRVVQARAEEFARGPERESFDVVVSRAVAELRVLAEFSIPLVKPGKVFIAMKGKLTKDAQDIDEIRDARATIKALGAEIEDIKQLRLPNQEMERNLILILKKTSTDSKYPRHYSQISKKPL